MKQDKISQDRDNVRSDKGAEYAPVQLVYSLDVFGCQWHARQSDQKGLKQPKYLKISFEKGAKEITGPVTPDQAWFGPEYLPAFTLPNYKSKFLTWLSDTQKDDRPTLFNLMGQCFQNVGLMEWTNIIPKQCPNNADRTKVNFDKSIRNCLEAITGFLNVSNQLIRWIFSTKKPTFMPMHEIMWHQVQLLSYFKGGYLRWTMEVPTAQEKGEQIFSTQPKAHWFKFVDLNKTVPTDPLKLIAFFEQCQATNNVAGILEKITKEKKQPKEKKTAHLLTWIELPAASLPQVLWLPLKQLTELQRLMTQLSSSRLSKPWLSSSQQYGV
jgi:hypothetical protein